GGGRPAGAGGALGAGVWAGPAVPAGWDGGGGPPDRRAVPGCRLPGPVRGPVLRPAAPLHAGDAGRGVRLARPAPGSVTGAEGPDRCCERARGRVAYWDGTPGVRPKESVMPIRWLILMVVGLAGPAAIPDDPPKPPDRPAPAQ